MSDFETKLLLIYSERMTVNRLKRREFNVTLSPANVSSHNYHVHLYVAQMEKKRIGKWKIKCIINLTVGSENTPINQSNSSGINHKKTTSLLWTIIQVYSLKSNIYN